MIVLSLLFATSLCLSLAGVIQLVYKNKTFFNYIISFMYFSLAYYMFYIWMYNSSVLPEILYGTDAAVSFFIGPLLFLYFTMITDSIQKKNQYIIPVFLWLLIIFSVIVLLNVVDPVEIKYTDGSYHPYFALPERLRILNSLSDYFFVICAAALFLFLIKKGIISSKRNNYNLLIFILSVLFLTCSSMMLLTHFIKSDVLVMAAIVLYGIFGFTSILFTYRYPKETQLFMPARAPAPKKDENPLWLEEADQKLKVLIEKDRIYSRSDISVRQVAELIGITENQMSRLVNRKYEMNFRSLINTRRLEEAKVILLEKRSMNILEVAFYTGFNSKSTFNTIFKQRYGMTPSEFRRSNTI